MSILAAIKREERKLEKQLGSLQYRLKGVRSAAEALGASANPINLEKTSLNATRNHIKSEWMLHIAAC